MRKIIKENKVSIKDENGLYTSQVEVPAPAPPPPAKEESLPDASPSTLLQKSMEILRREVVNLTILSKEGKLGEKSARDLASYIRLLHELAKDEKDLLDDMTEEELEQILKDKRDKT